MKYSKFIFVFIFIIFCFINTINAQRFKLSGVLGNNIAFTSSVKSILPNSIYTYSKKNNFGNELLRKPSYNIGLNIEYELKNNFSLFSGIHSATTETELIFEGFYNPVNYDSYVKYGYFVNTYEFPIGICYTVPIANNILMKNYLLITINLNGLSQGATRYRLHAQSSNSDTIRLSFTDIEGFPSGNSLGIRYGIGISPFKKFRNWEIGAYINFQFKRSITWDQEVEFENVSQNTYEYHHAILKDKADYFNFHLKYTFLKF